MAPPLAVASRRPYDRARLSRATRFLKELAGPHVLFASAVGGVHAWLRPRTAVPTPPLAPWYETGLGHAILVALATACVAGAAAMLAKRYTGNTLVSACAGALLALIPQSPIAPLIEWLS